MDLNIGAIDLIKLLGKFIAHKSQQIRLATKEYEIINTSLGKVKGLKRKTLYDEEDKYFAFEGIPFAKPPVGELRFRAPQPPEPWQDVLDCTDYKPKPMQFHFVRRMIEGSEDCLYLNVYSKKLTSSKPLPVMVWIYGGGFQIGEASRDIYAPDYFMQRDVVLVTFAYRLGVFGFLSLDDPDLQIPGNAGLKDQIMALKWVKENIHNFNGDPNNITLFGESAGGGSTHLMCLTPRTKGLFHKAIAQSGTALCPWVISNPTNWAYRLACQIGYKGNNNDKEVYRYLAKQSPSRLVAKDTSLLTKEEQFNHLLFAFGPVIEPYDSEDCVINKPIKEYLSSAWSNDIPMMIGGNSFEGLFHYSEVVKYPYKVNDLTDCVNLLPDDLKKSHSQEDLKAMGQRLKELYFGDKKPHAKETLYEFLHLMTQRTFWHGIHRAIKARTTYAAPTPTYYYQFDFDSKFFNHYRNLKCGRPVKGVCHADEISYMFYNINAEKLSTATREYKCIQRMIGMWYNFALTSNPNCREISPTTWEPVSVDNDPKQPFKLLNINDDVEFIDVPMHKLLTVWDSFYTKEPLC
ncbi:esterase B1 isoform X1 [Musca domestica]|uniref:carboxylesterase n=2 Tax=Musca domestica TaxID=7370 RepID=A0A1I8N171_MUSDO|nr:esterase B1 isoform X1 [Musca domestica]